MDDDVIVTALVVIDKAMGALGHRDDVRARASEAEVLTMAAARYFQNHLARALQVMQLCRYLSGPLSVSRFNRHLHALRGVHPWGGLPPSRIPVPRGRSDRRAPLLYSPPVADDRDDEALRQRIKEATMSGLKFGWVAPAVGPPESDHVPLVIYQQEEILPVAMQHFDSLWVCDHFYGFTRRSDPFVEGWTALTWLAAKYPNVQVGHHVLGVGYRNPALTGKMAATLQTMSGGRFILGIGAGWRDEEYHAYGYDFPRPAVRIAQLDEALQLMRLMWTEETPTFKGKHFQIEAAYAPPHPDPLPPILIGGNGEQLMLPLVGRQADMWNTGAGRGLESFTRKRDIIRRSAEAAGRDPSSIVLTVTREAPLPQTSDESAQWVEELQKWTAEGVSHILLDFGHVTSTEPVQRFVEEVMAPLR